MSDPSDAVASHALEPAGGEAVEDSRVLRFRPRNAWVGVLVFGSWGMVIAAPFTMFALSGELPARSLPAVLGLACVGYGLIYAAVRSVVNRARLARDQTELRFAFSPLWPHRVRRWRLADVRAAEMKVRPPSLWHPARYKGHPMPQPYLVDVCLVDGTRSRLPVTLGASDAQAVRRFVDQHADAR